MKEILKQVITLIIFFTVIHLALIKGSWLIFPELGAFDTELQHDTIYKKASRYIVMGRDAIRNDARKLFVLGSSNVQKGFQRREIAKSFPEYQVHKMAVGAMNFTQLNQVIGLIYESIDEFEDRQHVFVIGIWHGLLIDTTHRWEGGISEIEQEQRRFSLYLEKGNALRPIVPVSYFEKYVNFLRPYLIFDHRMKRTKHHLMHPNEAVEKLSRRIMSKVKKERYSEHEQNYAERDARDFLDDETKRRILDMWHNKIGLGIQDDKLTDKQFLILVEIAEKIAGKGDQLVLVDLPIPKWHSEGSEFFVKYQVRKRDYLNRIVDHKSVHYVNMQDMDGEEGFFDSVHPRPSFRDKWDERLVADLNGI